MDVKALVHAFLSSLAADAAAVALFALPRPTHPHACSDARRRQSPSSHSSSWFPRATVASARTSMTMAHRFRFGDPLSDLPDMTDKDADSMCEAETTLMRNKYLFNNKWFCDASLLAGPDGSERLIPVHTQVIGPASPPLAAMFGPNWRKDEGPVRLRDYEATVVLSVLRWVYCDELVFLEKDWVQLFQFAHQYLMKPVVALLVAKTVVQKANVWPMFSVGVKLDCQTLLDKCKSLIALRASVVLQSNDFLTLSVEAVTVVTLMDPLNASEFQLFTRCLDWAKEECERTKCEPTLGRLRSVMETFIKNIAFTNMTLAELSDVRKTEILTNEQRLQVFDHKSDSARNYQYSQSKSIKIRSKAMCSRGDYWCHGSYRCSNCVCVSCAQLGAHGGALTCSGPHASRLEG